MSTNRYAFAMAAALLAASSAATAGGVTAYLPMNLEPEVERQIERVLILADEPILKRPFSVELVKLALPQACQVDRPLCTRVQKYLERYSHDYGVTHASATGSITHSKDGVVLPNQHGMPVDSDYELSAVGYVQPTDYFLVSAGGIVIQRAYSHPPVRWLSLGTNWAQLDFGYRDHWFSPMTDSSSLISTEAPSTPSVTLSNYEPLTRLGFQYEFFLTRLSSQQIHFNGNQAIGEPRVFGAQFSIEPFSGWSLGINRVLEYGGGAGLPSSFRTLARNFFEPSGRHRTKAINRRPTSAASSYRRKRRLPSISSTPARTIPTAAATCSAVRRHRSASISRAFFAISMPPTKSPNGRISGTSTAFTRAA